MRIGVDAMGGDHAPKAVVEAVLNRAKEKKATYVLYGDREKIGELPSCDNIEVVHCSEVIEGDDVPTVAVRRKKDASMVRGLRDLKEKKIDGFMSAGNTGALLVGGMFVTGRLPNIKRPALTTVYPTVNGFCVLSDIGANADCQPEFILTFAKMSVLYAKEVLGITEPKVGLVNVGEEDTKGNELAKEAFKLLRYSDLHFIGNVEGRDIIMGKADVVVTDGFTGNVILKTTEGVASFFSMHLKKLFMASLLTKVSSLFFKKGITQLKKSTDYREYGGAPLLGIDGALVKAHGSSDPKAFDSALKYLEKYVSSGVVDRIRDLL